MPKEKDLSKKKDIPKEKDLSKEKDTDLGEQWDKMPVSTEKTLLEYLSELEEWKLIFEV